MPMEGWVKCLSAQNTSGVSGVNSVAVESNTIEDISDLSSDVIKKNWKNIACLHTVRVVSSKCLQAKAFLFDSK